MAVTPSRIRIQDGGRCIREESSNGAGKLDVDVVVVSSFCFPEKDKKDIFVRFCLLLFGCLLSHTCSFLLQLGQKKIFLHEIGFVFTCRKEIRAPIFVSFWENFCLACSLFQNEVSHCKKGREKKKEVVVVSAKRIVFFFLFSASVITKIIILAIIIKIIIVSTTTITDRPRFFSS